MILRLWTLNPKPSTSGLRTLGVFAFDGVDFLATYHEHHAAETRWHPSIHESQLSKVSPSTPAFWDPSFNFRLSPMRLPPFFASSS